VIKAQQRKERSAGRSMTETKETEMVARMASATIADNTGGFGTEPTQTLV
jgi:hypothetical protein